MLLNDFFGFSGNMIEKVFEIRNNMNT